MPATAKATKPVDAHRKQLIAKVHIGKQKLHLDDDTYRDMLESLFGKRSSKALSTKQLVGLVEHMKKQGFKDRPRRRTAAAPAESVTAAEDRERLLRKIRALWASLHHLGVLRDASETSLASFVRRVTGGRETGIAILAWLDGAAAFKVIEALKKMAERDGGVCWEAHRIATSAGPVTVYRPRQRVLEAQWRLMAELQLAKVPNVKGLAAYAVRAAGIGNKRDLSQLDEGEQDLVIAALGEQIRTRIADLGFDTVQAWKAAR